MLRSGDPSQATAPLRNAASSTLSPLAPPFTVDRSAIAAAPYHPAYHQDDPHMKPGPGLADCGWNAAFDVEAGGRGRARGAAASWMDPSLSNDSSPFPRGERSTVNRSLALNTTMHLQTTPRAHSPTASHSYVVPPSGRWPSSISSHLASPSIPSSGVAGSAPYYPYNTAAADAELESVLGIKNRGVSGDIWNGLFDGDKGGKLEGAERSSSWMNPSSSYRTSLYQKGSAADGFISYEDGSSAWRGKYDNSSVGKHYLNFNCPDWLGDERSRIFEEKAKISDWLGDERSRIFEEKAKISSNISGVSVYDSSALTSAWTPGPIPVTNAYGCSNSNSTYDWYMAQLDSCLTSPMIYKPYACSTSTQGYASPTRSFDPLEYENMPVFNSSKTQHVSPYEIEDGFADNLRAQPSQLVIGQDAEVEDGNSERGGASNNTNKNNGLFIDISLMTNDLSFGNDLPTGNSMNHSTDVESGLRDTHVNISTSPMIYKPYACSTSTQEHGSPTRSFDPSENKNAAVFNSSKTQHVSSYEIEDGFGDNLHAQPAQLVISQDTKVEDGNAERGRARNSMNNNNGLLIDISLMTNDLSLGNDLPSGNSMNHSTDVESGLRDAQVNISNSFTSEWVPAKPVDSVETLSGTLDQLNLAVDSPCWKGAPASRHSPFSACAILDSHSVVEHSKVCNNFDEGRKHSTFGLDAEAPSSIEKDGTLIYSENGKDASISCLKATSIDFSSTSTHRKFDDDTKEGLDHVKVENEEQSECSDILEEQKDEVRNHQKGSESKNHDLKELDQEANISFANQPVLARKISDPASDLKTEAQDSSSDLNLCARADAADSPVSEVSIPCDSVESRVLCDLFEKCSVPRKDAELLVKTIHSLSEVLLSTCSVDAAQMNEHDHELLQFAIENLKASITKSKMVTAEAAAYVSGPEAARSDVRDLEDDDMKQSKKKATQDIEGKTHHVVCLNADEADATCQRQNKAPHDFKGQTHHIVCLDANRLGNSDPEGSNISFRITNSMAQDLEKALKKRLHEQEDPQTLLYKNLWIQAEAALCSMKYELQLARMTQEMEIWKCQAQAKHPQESSGPGCKSKENLCIDASVPRDDAGKSSYIKLYSEVPSSKTHEADEVDASVMARLRILKDRTSSLSSMDTEEEEKLTGSIDINSRIKDCVCSPHTDIEAGVGPSSPPLKPANLGSIVGRSQTFRTSGVARDQGSDVKERSEPQNHGAKYNKEVGQGSGISEQLPAGVFHAFGPLIHSYILDCHASRFVAGSSDSPSSEWEHVQAEEATW